MVATTSLFESEQNQPTGDVDLDELVAEVREKTGENWQVVKRLDYWRRKHWWSRKKKGFYRIDLYVEVGGLFPFQVLQCVRNTGEAKAYLYGVLTGMNTEQTDT